MSESNTLPGNTRLVDEDEAAKQLAVSARTMQRMRYEGWGPEYVRVGLRRIAYSEAVLQAYVASRSHRSRAAELSAAYAASGKRKPRTAELAAA